MIQKCTAAFKKEVIHKCNEALVAAGFTRHSKDWVDLPFDKTFYAWVGLNTGLYDEYVQVNPFVGVHVEPVMKLVAKILRRKYSRSVATYAIHMGELAAKTQGFAFTPTTDIETEAARLAQLYVEIGLPYSRSIASYDALLPLLKSRVGLLGGYPERVASCLYLMGRFDEARQFIEELLISDEEYARRFSDCFFEMLPS
jgi:tetratricopeptide (TPR) repeat protein